jgi:hypothetical protein
MGIESLTREAEADRLARLWFETPCDDLGCQAKYHEWDNIDPDDKAEIVKTVTFILENAWRT